MAFRIESDDGGIGNLIARLQVPNVEALQAQSLQNQQAREQIARAPLVRQQLEQEIQAQKYSNQEHALSLQENAAYQQIMQRHAGEKDPWEAARGELAQVLRPKTYADLQTFYDTHAAKNADLKYKQAETNKMNDELNNAWAEQRGAMVEQVLRSPNPYTTMSATLSAMEDAHPDRKAAIDAVRQQLEQTDDYGDVMRLAAGFRTAKSQADAQALLEKQAQTEETGQKNLKDKLGIAGRTVPTDVNAPDFAARYTAWYRGLDDDVKRMVPAMGSPAAIDRIQKLGMTPAEIETARHNLETEATARMGAENQASEARLAKIATDPTRPQEERDAANAALRRLDQSKLASRPQVNVYPGVPMAATGATAELHGEDYLKTLPAAFAARVRQIISGDEPLPTGRAAVSGPGLQIVNAVYQTDPKFTPLLAQQRKETLKEFTNTAVQHAGGQVLSLNTLVHHADLFLEVADALKNGTWRTGNALYNRVAQEFGAAPPVQADLVARFLAGETGKVATGGVPGEGEVNGILANLQKNNSPDQLRAAGTDILRIAAGRMVPLKERRDQANLQNLVTILGPDAREILTRRGYDPETMKPAARGGGAAQHKVGDTVYFNGQPRTIKEIKPNGNLVLQ